MKFCLVIIQLLNYPTTEILLQNNTVTDQHDMFVQYNEEATAKLIPIKKRIKGRELADGTRVEKSKQ